MKTKLIAGAAGTSLLLAGLTVTATPASAAAPPVVTIAVSGDQATISQTTIRPGVVEFHVSDSFTVPGDQGGPEPVSIVRTDALDQVLATLPAVFSGDPSDPASMAAVAQGMRTVHALTTLYGGAQKGGVWQAWLPAGNYYVLGIQSAAMGMTKPVAFTVAGSPRSGRLHAVQAAFWASGPVGNNDFHFAQLGRQPVTWLSFRNAAKEIHFLDVTGVKPTTTNAAVRKALASNADPKFVTGPFFAFDVISPGVRVVIKQSLAPGKYLVDCFIPSETDGMPHALMGMWKLVVVR